jgi:hypothetical protein
MVGIDVSPAPSETYLDVITLALDSGATYIPQTLDWNSIEAGPDDAFDFSAIDTKKWDVTGPFAADATNGVIRYTSQAATSTDNLRTRYRLGAGAMSASVTAALVTASTTQATLLVRFGAADQAGNRCSQAGDEFIAIVLSSGHVAAASCRDGVFHNDGLVTAGASAPLAIRRTATQLILDTGTTNVTTLSLASLPAAFADAGRVGLFAGNTAAAATATFDAFRVTGTAAWDIPSDRFVGDPSFDILAVLELVEGPMHVPLVVNLRTIDTVTTQLPSDLQQLDAGTHLVDMSRADIRARYHDAIDYLIAHLPSERIVGFSVGNEVDAYVGSNATAWAQVTTFANDAIPYARSKLPAGTPVGITVTAGALQHHAAETETLQAAADVDFVTYYPLAPDFSAEDPSVVPSEIATMLAATSKPILFAEAGFPSAPMSAACPKCTGSEAKQAAFFHQMFAAMKAEPVRIRGLSATWLTDASDAAVAGWKIYYGVSDPTFVAYLATLGVRSQTGVPKQAWAEIVSDIAAH